MNLAVANAAVIIPVRCKIICKLRHPEQTASDYVVNLMEKHIPEARAKYCALKDFVFDRKAVRHMTLHHH